MEGLNLDINYTSPDFYNDFCQKKDAELVFAKSLPGREPSVVKTWKQIVKDGDFEHNVLWCDPNSGYRIVLDKFGKQHYPKGVTKQNINNISSYSSLGAGLNEHDMRPSVYNTQAVDMDLSFMLIYDLFVRMQHENKIKELVILGILFIRNALLIDHTISDDLYAYCPNNDVMQYLNDSIDTKTVFNIETLLHYVDAIALNEDVKYSVVKDKNGNGYNIKDLRQGIGRTNNVLTYVHLIAVLLDKARLSKLLADYSRIPTGVAPLALNESIPIFKTLLDEYVNVDKNNF